MMEDNIQTQNQTDTEKDFFESFDLERFWYVLKRSKFWLIGFVLLTTSLSYVYVRYTKPLYNSESIVKLEFESEANVLGLVEVVNTQERNEISGEIELIKSKLFLNRVADAAKMDVSYHVYGRYLTDERYRNSPFIVSYKIHNANYYNKPFDIEFGAEDSFSLSYQINDKEVENTYNFGEEIKTEDFNLLIQRTELFNPKDENNYFFIISNRDALISTLQNSLEVIPENFNAKTIKISYSDNNKYKARDLVALVDSLYLDYTREVKNAAIEQKIEFLNRQIESTEDKLEEYEDYFEQFTIENRTTNLDEDLSRTIEQLSILDSQRFSLRRNINDLNVIQNQVNTKGPIAVNPLMLEQLPKSLSEAISEYSDLQQERELKLASYNETSYIVEQLDVKMEKSKNLLTELLQSYDQTLEDRMDQIDRRRNILENNLSQMPSMGTEYGKNRRFYELQEEFMLSLQTSKMELEITRAGTVTKNVVLSPASLPQAPIKPQKALIVGAGFMVGLIMSVVYLLIRYLAHNKVAGVRELERLVKVPVLGAIPQYKEASLNHTSLVVTKDSKSSLSEALRTIRTNLDFIHPKSGSKSISVTSTISGEGKTFVAANLGAIMAMTGQKVCVVDIDMRKPKVHLAFGVASTQNGVSTILSGKSSVKESIQKSDIEGLDFVSAGPTPPNPSELLLQKGFAKMLEDLQKSYDVVILDTPPVGLVTDGRLVMKSCDIQLYIVRADYSRRSFIKVMNDLKVTGQFPNMTTILNAIDTTPGYGYGYGYGHGYYTDEESKRKKVASSIKNLF